MPQTASTESAASRENSREKQHSTRVTRAKVRQRRKPSANHQVYRCERLAAKKASAAAAPAALTDLDLIEGICGASEAHFNELYSRYFQRIYNFVYARIRNHADAEEIVQETFTIVFSSIDRYSGRSSLLSWIYGIAKNTTNNGLRQVKNSTRRMREVGHEQLGPLKSFANCTPEEQLSIRRYLMNVVEQLEVFGDWQVEIFDMRHLQNLSVREISKRTQRSSDSVRSCLYRVKRLLMETAQLDDFPSP